ncbi:hypothetical protein [Streptomyces sp. NPDC018059]|uniref:hypothetical protein n=1 Tax=Streptomyces sp. NPDC018059 TaxID=3365041 RepID=UPI0037B43544
MTFQNIFDSGGSEARSAEESARKARENIPGAWPEREGVDPELYDGIPEAARDPKIVRETSPEALDIMSNFIAPMFKNTQTAAAKQREASENPASTSGMASATKDEAFKKVQVEIKDEDQPKISDKDRPKVSGEQLEESRKSNRSSANDIPRKG